MMTRRFRSLGSLAVACFAMGCASPSTPDATDVVRAEGKEPKAIPEELLLDVGISVFDNPGPVLDGDDDESVFRNAEVLRAERNFVPYVIGKYLQGTQTWGAVRVVPRPVAVDLTVTGTITHSDGETLAFRAEATDARGVQWFDKEYRATAKPGAYDGDENVDDPFTRAYAALAADMASMLRELSLDDLARIRSVAELAFARSVAAEAFARHVTPKADGGHELHRLPANEDPLLARVRQVRDRDHLFIDEVNDYYDDFTANIQRPYDEWRREAFHSRRAQRELSAKADAQMLLGSARIIEGLARMEHGKPSRLAVDWITRGIGLIRGAEDSEEQIRETVDSMREIGRSTEASLLPHTTALENRTIRLQEGVVSRYDALRVILNRLYREEFGLAGSLEDSAPPGEGPVPEPSVVAENPKANAPSLALASSPRSASAVETGRRRSRFDERMLNAKEGIRSGNIEDAFDKLNDLLVDEDEELGAVASARIHALMALGHVAEANDREAIAAFERVVGSACTVICTDQAFVATRVVSRHGPPRPAVFKFIMEVQGEVDSGEVDAAIRSLGGSVGGEHGKSQSRDKAIIPGVPRLQPVEKAMAYQILARAYVEKKDYEGAIGVYERILALGTRAPRWHREFSNKNLALIHFSRRDYEKSLQYQNAWLRASSWVGEACPRVCTGEGPGAGRSE
ncbi:MAG: tetratricopeptide repeat protein [Gammaproteobacteria bacterium]|nr:tetratricopeptide repeat protein [Gammaproteobacteria bacterium]